MKCPLPQGVSNGADFAPTRVRASARNTPLGLGDADGGQPGALLAPRPRGQRILRFSAKRKSSLALSLVLFPPNPLRWASAGALNCGKNRPRKPVRRSGPKPPKSAALRSCGSFPGVAGNAPQSAPRAETRRRIPVQRRVILCGRYGFICRDFRDRAGNAAVPTLFHTCQQRHIRDTSETEQRQNSFSLVAETQLYQCFPRLLPRLYRLPHNFFTTLRL